MNFTLTSSTRNTIASITIILATMLVSGTAFAWDRGEAKTFALLPQNSTNPEALTADTEGNIYASTFFSGEVHRFSAKGELVSTIAVIPSSGLLVDLAFHPITNALLVVDFGGQKVLEVNSVTGSATTFADIPGGANAGPNVLTFDAQGNVYVSDSFQGTIWRIPATGGMAQAWLSHPLLTTTGFPPFGANGLAFNNDYSRMFVANTGEDTIVQIAVDNEGNASTVEILVNGLNGPDGLIVDEHNNILVAANQSNQIIMLDPTGKAISVLGDFEGINEDGIVEGLLFPADLIKIGKHIYVTNFALDVSVFGLVQNYSTPYSKQVIRHSIARIKLEKNGGELSNNPD
jgi:sugar lactone lactonase YvrE